MTHQDAYHAFMLDHAAGNHFPGLALAGDLHMLLSNEGAHTAYIWSMIGGALLEGADDSPVTQKTKRKQGHRSIAHAETLLIESDADLNWRTGLSGVAYAKTRVKGAKYMKLEPGQSAPAHSHSALEATVVLHGQFTDGHGIYTRGDLVIGEPGMRHKPAAHGDETCICFVAQAPRPFWRLT